MRKLYKIKCLDKDKFLKEIEYLYLIECEEKDATLFTEEQADNIVKNLSEHAEHQVEKIEVQ